MTPADKLKIAQWLRKQIKKLKRLPHYEAIRDKVAKLEAEAERLEAEAE